MSAKGSILSAARVPPPAVAQVSLARHNTPTVTPNALEKGAQKRPQIAPHAVGAWSFSLECPRSVRTTVCHTQATQDPRSCQGGDPELRNRRTRLRRLQWAHRIRPSPSTLHMYRPGQTQAPAETAFSFQLSLCLSRAWLCKMIIHVFKTGFSPVSAHPALRRPSPSGTNSCPIGTAPARQVSAPHGHTYQIPVHSISGSDQDMAWHGVAWRPAGRNLPRGPVSIGGQRTAGRRLQSFRQC
eukprot:COSAG06_NODE_6893_length_2727_cov_1.593227_4_plen_241_part_00